MCQNILENTVLLGFDINIEMLLTNTDTVFYPNLSTTVLQEQNLCQRVTLTLG